MDLGRRETPLLMGVAILVTLVAIVLFSMSLAWRQLAARQVRWAAMQEQLRRAEQQAHRRADYPAEATLAAESQDAGQFFTSAETLPWVCERLKVLGADAGVAVTVMPALAPESPAVSVPGFEGCYQVLPIVATAEGRARPVALWLGQAAGSSAPRVTLRSATVSAIGNPDTDPRVRARVVLEVFRWLPGALPPLAEALPAPPLPAGEPGPPWGRDPFDGRWVPGPAPAGLALHGVLWDRDRPTCVINGEVMGVGDAVGGYTIAAILPSAVLLRGPRERVVGVS